MKRKPAITMTDETEELIKLILEQSEKLLRDHWVDVQAFRKDDTKIKVNLIHTLRWRGSERIVKTAVSFGRRFKETAEQSFDLDQLELSDSSGDGLGKRK